jgi:basic membrane lipoprotein Med (substrate-binding protein (PBP1-ABC) superfamily)
VVSLAQRAWKSDGKEVWSMGNDAPMGVNGPDRYITGMMFNWNVLYKHIVDQLAEGKLQMGNRWAWGLQENCVGLSPWGKNVPGEVVNKVETVKMNWINDEMGTYYPFDQGVTKQDGTKVPAGEIQRPQLETMQYFVKGVVSRFPTK